MSGSTTDQSAGHLGTPGSGLATLLAYAHLEEKSTCPSFPELRPEETFSLPWKTLTNTYKTLSCIFILQIINYLEWWHLLPAQTRECRGSEDGREAEPFDPQADKSCLALPMSAPCSATGLL